MSWSPGFRAGAGVPFIDDSWASVQYILRTSGTAKTLASFRFCIDPVQVEVPIACRDRPERRVQRTPLIIDYRYRPMEPPVYLHRPLRPVPGLCGGIR